MRRKLRKLNREVHGNVSRKTTSKRKAGAEPRQRKAATLGEMKQYLDAATQVASTVLKEPNLLDEECTKLAQTGTRVCNLIRRVACVCISRKIKLAQSGTRMWHFQSRL